MIADRRLFLTADRKTIVEEGDPRAAFLYCLKGDYFDEVEARNKNWPSSTVKEEPQVKAILEPPTHKAILTPENIKRTRPRLIRRRQRHG